MCQFVPKAVNIDEKSVLFSQSDVPQERRGTSSF